MSKPPMTVRTLIRALSKQDPGRLVVFSHGAKTTAFPVHTVATAAYDARHHEIGLEELTPADIRLGWTNDDILPGGRPAVVLFT